MVSDEEFSDALDLKDVVMSEQMHRKDLMLNSLKTISSQCGHLMVSARSLA